MFKYNAKKGKLIYSHKHANNLMYIDVLNKIDALLTGSLIDQN